MTDHKALSQALADQAEAVCRNLLPSGHREGRWWVTGSTQGERGRSLNVSLTTGKWRDNATNQYGNLIGLAMEVHGLGFRDALSWAQSWLGHPPPPVRELAQPEDRREAALKIWQECSPGASLVRRYLASRAITLPLPDDLRVHPDLWHSRAKTRYPAMVAAVRNSKGDIVAVHRTWLKPDGSGKAPVDPQKMSLGSLTHTAIRLAPTAEILGVAEGIETALSATQLYGIPVWSCLSAPVLAGFQPPPDVRLVIFADRDAAGLDAARKLASRTGAQIKAPREGDFNDVLLNLRVVV